MGFLFDEIPADVVCHVGGDLMDVELRLWHAARERWRRAWSWAYIA